MSQPRPAPGRPGPDGPGAELLAAFTTRTYLCHQCGGEGAETRETDQVRGTVRYRLGAGVLLLPCCPDCAHDERQRWRARTTLRRAVEAGTLAWVDPGPLAAYCCPVPGCGRLWHHLGGPLPYPVVEDPHMTMPHRRWHPCPWCTADDPAATTATHERCRRAVEDVRRWEDELHTPGT
ncbi:hypothetical protein LQ327_29605 [Actinomycetospora endophytica]|uniref:Uncharacterized protein n=1 Tax=Actinomycetospora endophytica TaxID=2291215 RepID=A0ABS8PGZ8_9PSEU|nr:hypothetical protein [Actinomycetospora endophytica]MCD2197535.1 hypothetical protein [Actinomycetospora endophytica]